MSTPASKLESAHAAGRCGPLCPFCIFEEDDNEGEDARCVREAREYEIACDTGD